VILALLFYTLSRTAPLPREHLVVAFLDVGQGDAIYIQAPNGTQVLIDGGRDQAVLRSLAPLHSVHDRSLDLVVATHFDADHIGGLIDVFARYAVETVVTPDPQYEAPAATMFFEAMDNEGASHMIARRGQIFDLGMGPHGSTTLTVLFPDRDTSAMESNAASIIARLSYGEIDYFLSGDAPTAIEEYIVSLEGKGLESEVLKLGHHGSDTSSSPQLLDTVRPLVAVVSAGKDNAYGHPHDEVLARLADRGIPHENTAERGSVVFVSDGTRLWLR
jgi:competence protein ComEC